MDCIYLDNNATTPLLPAVWEAMRPYLTDIYGNPASAHRVGSRARKALEDAREQCAALLGAFADEVVFTSGATEANNLAIFGLAGASEAAPARSRLITSPIEHPSALEPILQLEKNGFLVDRLPVDSMGIVRTELLAQLLRPETKLANLMLVNHETGAVQPVQELAAQVNARIAVHCDAVQAVGKLPVHFRELGVTTLTLSAHKFHGPKGVGALLVRRGTRLQPRTWGGHQQQGRRPGTEPVALAVGLASALDHAHREAAARTERVLRLRTLFLDQLQASADLLVVNGPPDDEPRPRGSGARCVPHTLNVSFPGCQADSLLMNLDLAGVACSTGSACSSGSLLPSPVLQAMQVPEESLRSAMRFSLSYLLTEEEVQEAARRIAAVVQRLRRG
jgi:cysteine desulfurase